MEMLVVDLIVLFLTVLLFTTTHATNLEKREFCYDYIQSYGCSCSSNVDLLLNKDMVIDSHNPIQNSGFDENKVRFEIQKQLEIQADFLNKTK